MAAGSAGVLCGPRGLVTGSGSRMRPQRRHLIRCLSATTVKGPFDLTDVEGGEFQPRCHRVCKNPLKQNQTGSYHQIQMELCAELNRTLKNVNEIKGRKSRETGPGLREWRRSNSPGELLTDSDKPDRISLEQAGKFHSEQHRNLTQWF